MGTAVFRIRVWVLISIGVVLRCGLFAGAHAEESSFLLRPEVHEPAAPVVSEADSTLVVFNNLYPASVDLAGYYADKRGIPFDHLIGLDCSMKEEISREEFDRTIAGPLRKAFQERGWWKVLESGSDRQVVENKIRWVALMHGIPLKIAAVESYEGDKIGGTSPAHGRNEAAVDSELATLGFLTRTISGPLPNPYYRSYTRLLEAGIPALMLVCRLDAPTPSIVRRMIDDSFEAEQNGMSGFAYIDERGIAEGAYSEGDKWLTRVAGDLRQHGIPVIVDNGPELFPPDYPMTHVAFYYGWYTERVSGPFARDDFRFEKGAVACHIHSSSGASLRDPTQFWVAPLLAHGAAASMGNVYEPYLSLTPILDVFNDRLCNGFTFAESAYMSMRVVSWMTTLVGDPLYRPFKNSAAEMRQAQSGSPLGLEWAAYRNGALVWFRKSPEAGKAQLQKAGNALRSGIVFEGLGLLHASVPDFTAAIGAFQQARQYYKGGDDILRVTIYEVNILKGQGKKKEALALARKMMRAHPGTHGFEVLRSIENELAPPPPSPTARPQTK